MIRKISNKNAAKPKKIIGQKRRKWTVTLLFEGMNGGLAKWHWLNTI